MREIIKGVELIVVGIIELRRDLGEARPFVDHALRVEGLRQEKLAARAHRDASGCEWADESCEPACWMHMADVSDMCEGCIERHDRHEKMLEISSKLAGARCSMTAMSRRALAKLPTCEECGALATHAVRDMHFDADRLTGQWIAGERRHGCDEHPRESRRFEP